MKTLFLLLLVYANMGFTAADKGFQPAQPTLQILSASETREGVIIVASPDACRVVMH